MHSQLPCCFSALKVALHASWYPLTCHRENRNTCVSVSDVSSRLFREFLAKQHPAKQQQARNAAAGLAASSVGGPQRLPFGSAWEK
jgi:hypothetical protein